MNALFPSYKIRAARIEDLLMLAEIEQAAATLFCDTPYAFLVDAEPLSLGFVTQQFREGRVWVAVDERETPVGYAISQDVDGNAYLQQIDVHPAYGRRGIGRELVEIVCVWAKHQNYRRILLSTFRDIEWNAPFYAKLGFQILAEVELTSGFQQLRYQEAEAGLPIDKRVIMYRELQQSNNMPLEA
ncbi:MAG: GNAT family N-acetyltransferase [Symplocastrum torsivum CPER-KK1]|jgi:ribosomal protein S18 acetylase RimI-like enzyme|uniref:GNAT family N-acetyltransferase n=1 Tax=Symplocastrum torsivum CPER-KK1 TaxID=450513 RepID=A0A951PQL1_9CYAN|nr:GNAT family N-acetyltransferase [Symplocastrum torsivum CPER-KK1]